VTHALFDWRRHTLSLNLDTKVLFQQFSLERVWLLEEVLAVETDEVEVIDDAVARQLHIELGTLGYKNHYQLASDALGRRVNSLVMITAEGFGNTPTGSRACR